MNPAQSYVFNLLMAVDRLANAVRGGDGRLTISGACWRGQCAGDRTAAWWRARIDYVALHAFGQVDHCRSSDAYDCALVAVSVVAALQSLASIPKVTRD